MNIIKEAFKTTVGKTPAFRYIIRTNTYGHSVAYFKKLDREIYRDFGVRRPAEEDLEIVQYGGRHYSGTFGIEFTVAGSRNENYAEVSGPELKL